MSTVPELQNLADKSVMCLQYPQEIGFSTPLIKKGVVQSPTQMV